MQDRIALSSAEAELKSTCKGIVELISSLEIMTFIRGIGWSGKHKTDASACKGILLRQGAGTVKHLNVKTLWVQEVIQERGLIVEKIRRDMNPADALCSSCREDDFAKKMSSMGLIWTGGSCQYLYDDEMGNS